MPECRSHLPKNIILDGILKASNLLCFIDFIINSSNFELQSHQHLNEVSNHA